MERLLPLTVDTVLLKIFGAFYDFALCFAFIIPVRYQE